ncbi:MAG: MBL fold metallo-hydrolase [Bacteroidota bacterium]
MMSRAEVDALYEGTWSVGLDKVFHPMERDEPARKGTLKLSINPFLIQHRDRIILFDAGLGDLAEESSIERILGNLKSCGVESTDVTDVVVSHLHYDHFAGLVRHDDGFPDLTFPDATVWVNREGWRQMKDRDGDTDDDIRKTLFHFLDARADLQFLESESEPFPGLKTHVIGGHTQYSQLLEYTDGETTWLMAGDNLGRRSAILRNFKAKYDYEPEASHRFRESLRKRAASGNIVLMAYHESDSPLFRVEKSDGDSIRTVSVANAHEPGFTS